MIVIDYPRAGTHCMSGDNIQELHEFAKKLGLSGTQFIEHPGHPHYILQAGGMLVRKALTMGARGLSNNEYVHFILNNWRPKKVVRDIDKNLAEQIDKAEKEGKQLIFK